MMFYKQGCCRFIMLVFLFCGCAKEPLPPKAISVEDTSTGLEETFKTSPEATATQARADDQVRQLVADAKSALSAKDYARALFSLQALSGRGDLTDNQRDFVTRAMLSVHQVLEQAAGAGDQNAKQALDLRRATK